jgi:S-(hydroxymethyl)glutathione dehydrogenase/alcohol dehydrogenase
MSMLPKTMRAAVLTELRAPLQIAEVTLPETLAVGQVLVKVHFSGICGSQLGEIDGAKGEDKFLPHLLGHEASGAVLAVGGGVRHVRVGDKVVLHWRKGLGIEAETAHFSWEGRKVNAGWITTFNEYAIVSENRVTAIPADSDMEVAALFGCAVTTGFGIVENNAKVRIGESLVVFGAGGIGLNIIQAFNNSGGGLDQTREGLERLLDSLGLRGGVDGFIDNTGLPAVIEMGYQMTKPQGRVTLVGVPRKNQNINIHSLPLHFGKVLCGSHGGEAIPQTDIPRYQNLYRAGRLLLRELITDRFSLDQINAAIAAMRSGGVRGRCLIDMAAT